MASHSHFEKEPNRTPEWEPIESSKSAIRRKPTSQPGGKSEDNLSRRPDNRSEDRKSRCQAGHPRVTFLTNPAEHPKATVWGPFHRVQQAARGFQEIRKVRRPHLPKQADDRARRNFAKQPTTRLYSADESVAERCSCPQRAARSFHGLCVPSKVNQLPLQPGVYRAGELEVCRPKPTGQEPWSLGVTANRHTRRLKKSLRRLPPTFQRPKSR